MESNERKPQSSQEHGDHELVIKVKPGTKARVVEDKGLDRDVQLDLPQNLKITVHRAQRGFEGSPSTITMCG